MRESSCRGGSAGLHAFICEGLEHLGIVLEPSKNDVNNEAISKKAGLCVVTAGPPIRI